MRTSGESEESFRVILEHAGIAIAVLEGDTTISFVNLEFLRLFERAPQTVEGKKWADVAPVKSTEIIRRLSGLGPGAPPVEYEIPWVGLDGHGKQILAIFSALPEPGGYVACFLDVTSEIHAREALWECEDKFRAVFHGAAVGISVMDPEEGKIILSNLVLQKMLGYTAGELSGMRFAAFTHPDDVENQWTLYKEMVAGNLKRFEMKKRYIRKDGTVIRARLVASLALMASGKPAVVIGMIEEMD